MPRFVLLHHECPPRFEKPSHWDFMLEMGGVLRTWELRELPSAWRGVLARPALLQPRSTPLGMTQLGMTQLGLTKATRAEPPLPESPLGNDSAATATTATTATATATVTACQLPDHRLVYLDYEGPLTGDRGRVRCCERGTYQLLQASENALSVLLSGVVLQGKLELLRRGPTWQLTPAGVRR